MGQMGKTALIGSTGFVGGALQRHRTYDRVYHSRTIADIAGERFDLAVCAGAPATMWAANADPEGDLANLGRLLDALGRAEIGRLALISTIAVLDDASAGYTEASARYEQAKAYGRNRRWLEEEAQRRFSCTILRLPALFGAGLKKNFIFDLLHPIPSFVAPAKFDALLETFSPDARALARAAFAFDPGVKMWAFDRAAYPRSSAECQRLEAAFAEAGFLARGFTHSQSAFQYYNIDRLADDLDVCVTHAIGVLHVCSEPLQAGDVHRALTGEAFVNEGPAQVREDMRTEHAGAFGKSGPYLYSQAETLADLRAFYDGERAR